MSKKYDHIHKYYRVELKSGAIVYRCGVPNCRHYLTEEFVIGQVSKCWRCPDGTVVVKRNNKGKLLHKPHCEDCTRPNRNKAIAKVAARKRVPTTDVQELARKILGGGQRASDVP